MAETHHFTCDVCDKQSPATGSRYPFGDALPDEWRRFTVRHPDSEKDRAIFKGLGTYRTADCCSEACLRKAMQKYLDKTETTAA